MQERPSRAELMRIIVDANGYTRSSKKRTITTYRAGSHKYHVTGMREDLAGKHKPERISYYVDSIANLEIELDTYADYWKRCKVGHYSALTGGFMSTLYVDRIY